MNFRWCRSSAKSYQGDNIKRPWIEPWTFAVRRESVSGAFTIISGRIIKLQHLFERNTVTCEQSCSRQGWIWAAQFEFECNQARETMKILLIPTHLLVVHPSRQRKLLGRQRLRPSEANKLAWCCPCKRQFYLVLTQQHRIYQLAV